MELKIDLQIRPSPSPLQVNVGVDAILSLKRGLPVPGPAGSVDAAWLEIPAS